MHIYSPIIIHPQSKNPFKSCVKIYEARQIMQCPQYFIKYPENKSLNLHESDLVKFMEQQLNILRLKFILKHCYFDCVATVHI